MKSLVIAEHDGALLSAQSVKALAAAFQLGGQVDVLVAGLEIEAIARQAAGFVNVDKVLVAEGEAHKDHLPEPLAELVVRLAPTYGAILAAATSFGRSVLPRIAAKLDVMQVSDVISIEAPDTYRRPTYAGNAIQTVRSTDATKVLSIRATAFPAAASGGAATIERIACGPVSTVSSLVGRSPAAATDRPELTGARIVVSGGRALGSKENFDQLIQPLADALGAAVGASRAAVDAGYASNDLQVGQTGKIVAPELYIALGISGAIQHLAGMKDSKVIVAINKDADAPIFQSADYGLVGDIFELVPLLQQAFAR